MKKLDECLSLAIGTSMSIYGQVDVVFVRAFLMGHIIGTYKRDINKKEKEFINSIRNKIK